jgi:hypothetical protein
VFNDDAVLHLAHSHPDSEVAKQYLALAEKVAERCKGVKGVELPGLVI